VEYSL